MKNCYCNYIGLNAGILVLLTFFLHSCGQKNFPSEIVGQWKSNKIQVTVRTQDENRKFEFTSDSAIITLKINNDHTVDGSIGSAKIENGRIKTNWLLPIKMSGLAFTVEFGKIGKIFENDPLDSKEVELWLGPIIKGTIDGELRYTEGPANFPMAGMIFTRKDN